MKHLYAFLRTTWLYGLLGGLYICVNAWIHPETLPLQLTHLTPWIREDTFGMLSFIVSAMSYFGLQLIKKYEQGAEETAE
jgi:hypothetical protein